MNGDFNANQGKKIGIVIPIYNVAKYLRQCLDSVLNQTYGNFHAVLVNDGSNDILSGESKSESLQIALEYVAKDERFVLIDKANGGSSSARNVGIKYFSQIIDSALSAQKANSSIFDEKSGLRSYEQGNRTSRSLTKRVANLPDLSHPAGCETLAEAKKDEEFVPKIDYIIFLDSDDFWEVNLLESCVESMQKYNAEIVWFDHNVFYDIIGGGAHSLKLLATRKIKLSLSNLCYPTLKSAKSMRFGGRGRDLLILDFCAKSA